MPAAAALPMDLYVTPVGTAPRRGYSWLLSVMPRRDSMQAT